MKQRLEILVGTAIDCDTWMFHQQECEKDLQRAIELVLMKAGLDTPDWIGFEYGESL